VTGRSAALAGLLVATIAVLALAATRSGDDGAAGQGSVPISVSAPPAPGVASSTSSVSQSVATTAVSTAPPPTSTSTTTTSTPATTTSTSTTTTTLPVLRVAEAGYVAGDVLIVAIRVESRTDAVDGGEFADFVMNVLHDPAGWPRAGITFELDPSSPLVVVVADPADVDALCLPLQTRGEVSCQNGEVVALNRDRWLTGPAADKGWDSTLEVYRQYLVNHEVGHLIGLRHPTSRCPIPGGRAAVMEQQTGGLVGCTANGLPLDWEIEWARRRPAMIAPDPDWNGPFPDNPGDG